MTDLKIADLVTVPDISECLEYPDIPGFKVQLRTPDNPERVRLATHVAGIQDVATQNADFHYLRVKYAVAGWEGLTVGALEKLFPVKKLNLGDADRNLELAYNPENLDFLLAKSEVFYRWVNAWINARDLQEEADSKN